MRVPRDRALATVLVVWVMARIAYVVAGVSFDAEPITNASQFIDRGLLEHDLWRSVWNLHSQPPLFNVVLGLVLRLPFDPGHSFGVLFRVMGMAIAVVLYSLLVGVGVTRRGAAVLTILFTCTPPAVLYENYLFYPLPVALLVSASTLALLRFLRGGRIGAGLGFGASVAALALTRSTYHLVWVAGAALFVVLASRGRMPGKTVAIALLPLSLVVGLYVKNLVVFDSFTASTWLGMNLAHMTIDQEEDEELAEMVGDGTLSEQALVSAFGPLSMHADDDTVARGVPVLDRETAHEGRPNYNNLRYIAISERYLDDSIAYVKARPGEYAESVAAALRYSLLPSSDYPFVDRNRVHVHGLDRVAWAGIGMQPRAFDDRAALATPKRDAPSWTQVSWTVALAYLATVVVAPVVWARRLRALRGSRARDAPSGNGAPDSAATLAMLYACGTVAFVFLSGIMLEIGENNRFRFETDPLALVVTAALVSGLLAGRRRRQGDRDAGSHAAAEPAGAS